MFAPFDCQIKGSLITPGILAQRVCLRCPNSAEQGLHLRITGYRVADIQ
jgi:hypothetical protein